MLINYTKIFRGGYMLAGNSTVVVLEPIDPKINCPGCLGIYPQGSVSVGEKTKIDIHVTINFRHHDTTVSVIGDVRISLKELTLSLELENAKSFLLARNYASDFVEKIDISRTEKNQNKEEVTSRKDEFEVSISTKESKVGYKHTNEYDDTDDSSIDSYDITQHKIGTMGTVENPKWVFESATKKGVLKGAIKNKMLCTLTTQEKGRFVRIHVNAKALQRHLYFETDYNPKNGIKKKILNAYIFKKIKHLIEPHIYSSELLYLERV